MPSHVCSAGTTKYGETYWITTQLKPVKKEVEYQQYQCRHDDCSKSIPLPTGNNR